MRNHRRFNPSPQKVKGIFFSCFLIHKTTYRWQFITLPTSELHRHPVTGFYPKPRSIIITDMLHRPAHLLCILSGSYRSMPLLQCPVLHFLTSIPKPFWDRHIVAHPHRGYTYPHVLYAMRYSVVKIRSPYGETRPKARLQFQLMRPIFAEDTFQDFFALPLLHIIHFLSHSCSVSVSVLLYGL